MNTNIKIEISLRGTITFDATPNIEDWENANEESRLEYVTTQAKEYLNENIDEIMDVAHAEYVKEPTITKEYLASDGWEYNPLTTHWKKEQFEYDLNFRQFWSDFSCDMWADVEEIEDLTRIIKETKQEYGT